MSALPGEDGPTGEGWTGAGALSTALPSSSAGLGVARNAAGIPGERGPAWVWRAASMQSRVQNVLAAAVVVLLGGAFLFWYYSRVAAAPPPAAERAKAQAAAAASGEMALPPLGPPLGPAPVKASAAQAADDSALVDPNSADGRALLAGEVRAAASADAGFADAARGAYSAPMVGAAAASPPAIDPVRQRRLEAPVLIRGTGQYATPESSEPEGQADALSYERAVDGPAGGRPGTGGLASGVDSASGVGERLLRSTRTAAVTAAMVGPERRYLLPKGAFIDCTLETAIDSTLPGLTTCVAATDVWSADGSMVLLERGTKLVGETRGEARTGQQRLFVLWNEARTPSGVIVALDSPGTDALGRSGVTGAVDTHFAARFGAAILVSVIDAGMAAVVAAQGEGSGSVVIAPQGAGDVAAEVLQQTADVRPTIRVAQGARMQVLVARDVSFAEVYALVER